MSRRRRLLHLYGRVGRVYWAWAPSLILLAAIVFIPVGLLDALLHGVDTSALSLSGDFEFAAFLAAAAAAAAGGLFGEVFFSGAVAISLTHPEHEHPPTLRALARHISYGKLIAVDILYVVSIVLGAFVLVVGLVVPLIYFGLAGPVVELERHSVRGGFVRSYRLVRGHFWMVAAVVIPVEVVGDVINDAVVGLSHSFLGHGFLAAWVGESAGNIVTTPFFAVAVVLLALELIHHHDGSGPALKHRPEPIPAPEPV